MNRTQALAIAVIGGLAVTNVAQMVRISGLEGRVRVLEEQAMQVSERQARGWRGAGRTRVVDQPLSGLAQSLNRPPPPTGTSPGEEDIAGMVVYLCSDQGAWITGQLYSVDGGTLPGR